MVTNIINITYLFAKIEVLTIRLVCCQTATYRQRLVAYISSIRVFSSVHQLVCCRIATCRERLVIRLIVLLRQTMKIDPISKISCMPTGKIPVSLQAYPIILKYNIIIKRVLTDLLTVQQSSQIMIALGMQFSLYRHTYHIPTCERALRKHLPKFAI